MCEFIFYIFLAIVSGVACEPKIRVHTKAYDNKFTKLDSQTFPYDSIDAQSALNRVAFLIVGRNDFWAITKNETIRNQYHDLEDKIRNNHGGRLALIGCFDFEPHDLIFVDKFIKESGARKIRTFGYGRFNTNYTIKDNRWDDDSIDLLLNEFMKDIHGDKYERHEFPIEYVSIFDPNTSPVRLESFRMNTKNGRFESKIAVTFILISGDKMDDFLKSNHEKELLKEIVAKDSFGLVFLMGCYNFRNKFYLIADVIEKEKKRLVGKHRGPMNSDNIHVYVQGRGIWSSDFVYINKPNSKLIPNVNYPGLDPFLDLYYKNTSKHTEYVVYDCNLENGKQLRFEYLNGLYRPHAAVSAYTFDTSAKVIKFIFITKAQFDSIYSDDGKTSMFKHVLNEAQPDNHKLYVVVCHADISTYPNVVVSMLERHLGIYMRKHLGEVYLSTPKTFDTIQRSGDGARYKELSCKPIDDILERA